MYKFIAITVIVLVALEGASAKARPKQAATAPSSEKSQIEELAAQAQTFAQNVTAVLEGNLPDANQLVQSLTDANQKVAAKVKSFLDDISQKTQENQGQIETALTKIKESLSATAAQLQTSIGPEAAAKAKDLKAQWDEGVKNAIAQAEKLAKAAEPEATKLKTELTDATKTFLNQLVDVVKGVEAEVSKAAKKPK